jgi:16S rRNA (cytosine967-C5)-methyltransferase
MNISYLSSNIQNLLHKLLEFKYPADGIVRYYFKERPKIGSRERMYISDAVFSILRNLSLFRSLSQSSGANLHRSLALLGLLYHRLPIDKAEIRSNITLEDIEWLNHIHTIKLMSLKPKTRYSIPDYLWDNLNEHYGEDFATKLAQSLLSSADLDIRVNTLKCNVNDCIKELQNIEIKSKKTVLASNGLKLEAKYSVHKTDIFEKGWFEIQDEGSQLLCQVLAPKRGEMVVDFCAGAGGKTLAMGAMMKSSGRIYAFDVDEKRLKSLKPRMARSGLSNVYTALIAHENDSHIKRLHGKIDKVLLDVPCSGTGTLRRNPDLKWRQSSTKIEELNAKQRSILQNASKLLKVGGTMLYATCSVMPQENEAIIQEFLSSNPSFSLVNIQQVLNKQNVDIVFSDDYFRLYPHVHGTDGFFGALIIRNAA